MSKIFFPLIPHKRREARGLLQLVKDGKKPKYFAHKLGKTEKHIHQRLSLNQLSDYWQQLFLDGSINLTGALTIARLSKVNQAQQQKAYLRERIEKDGKISSTFGSLQLDEYIRKHFFLALHATDFSKHDPDLYPKAGACLACKKRTGCNKMLFAELDKEDFCMDADCFAEKNKRHITAQMRLLAEANTPFHKIATRYGYSEEKGVLRSYEYTLVLNAEEVTQDCHKAVVVEGIFRVRSSPFGHAKASTGRKAIRRRKNPSGGKPSGVIESRSKPNNYPLRRF